MPQKKIKSSGYLEFLSNKRCVVTGKNFVDIHHESLLKEFSGASKKYNDYQALPLEKNLHLYKRHSLGKIKFWETFYMNPYSLAISFLEEYVNTNPEDVEEASYYLEEIKKQKVRWSGPEKPRYKSI